MIIVLKLTGKGDSKADEVSVRLFAERFQAEEYIAKVQNLDTKYWTACQIVDEFETVETYRDYYKD